MTKNPIVNALVGLSYIVVVVSGLYYSSALDIPEPNVFIPITVLSLFVFSAATMGYIFLSEPLQLFLDGKKKEGIDLFLTTLAAFAVSAFVLVSAGWWVTTSLS